MDRHVCWYGCLVLTSVECAHAHFTETSSSVDPLQDHPFSTAHQHPKRPICVCHSSCNQYVRTADPSEGFNSLRSCNCVNNNPKACQPLLEKTSNKHPMPDMPLHHVGQDKGAYQRACYNDNHDDAMVYSARRKPCTAVLGMPQKNKS